MKIVRFKYDPARTTLAIHNATMIYLMALGYEECAEMSEVSTDEKSLPIPPLYDFSIPSDATIDLINPSIPIIEGCRQMVTDKSFGTTISKTGPMRGGFYSMNKHFLATDARQAIQELAQQTGRKFRLGTPLEVFMLYTLRPERFPGFCAVLGGELSGDRALRWRDGVEFITTNFSGEWGAGNQVFFVEEL